MESIETLVTQAIAGDKNAVADLYNRTYHAVYQTVRALIRCDEDTVLDLVQDTYVRGFQHLKELDAPALFPAWIKRIGINTAKNYLKKKRPMLFSDMSTEDDESPELRIEDDCPENLPEVRLDQKETARLLGEILDSLSEEQRVVVTMFILTICASRRSRPVLRVPKIR
ncbi:MAG: sigma-70 family RNA polymerase sigma factor [Clostridia bacterium]|nr:sigma-70 family RNA polymerase sigma factor [Clostridia bacterium]